MNHFTVCKGNCTANWVNFIDVISSVLLHILRKNKKVVIHFHQPGLTVEGFIISNLQLDTGHRRLLRRDYNRLQIKILIRTTQILNVNPLHFNPFYQLFVISIQRIQNIYQLMVLLVSRRVIQTKKRIKFLKALLCRRSTHFLRFIQNHNWTVCLNNIYRSPGPKIIQLHPNSSCIFTTGIKCLNVDYHDANICTLAKIINLCQIFRVIYKSSCLLSIILHEMLLHGIKALADALTDSNAWNNYYKFTPAVLLIQFKHRFNINIGLSSASLHFHIKGTGS